MTNYNLLTCGLTKIKLLTCNLKFDPFTHLRLAQLDFCNPPLLKTELNM